MTNNPQTDTPKPERKTITTCPGCTEPVVYDDAQVIPFRGKYWHDKCMLKATNHADYEKNPRFSWNITSYDAETILRSLRDSAKDGDLGAQRLFAILSIRLREADSSVVECSYCKEQGLTQVIRREAAIEGSKTAEQQDRMAEFMGHTKKGKLGKHKIDPTVGKKVHYFCSEEHDVLFAAGIKTKMDRLVGTLLNPNQQKMLARLKELAESKDDAPQDTVPVEADSPAEAPKDESTDEIVASSVAKQNRLDEIEDELREMSSDEIIAFVDDDLVDEEATEHSIGKEVVILKAPYDTEPLITCQEVYDVAVRVLKDVKKREAKKAARAGEGGAE